MNDEQRNALAVGCLIGFTVTCLFLGILLSVVNNDDIIIKQAKIQFFQELQENGFTIKDPKGLNVEEISFEKKPEVEWTHKTSWIEETLDKMRDKSHIIRNGKFVPSDKDCPCQDE